MRLSDAIQQAWELHAKLDEVYDDLIDCARDAQTATYNRMQSENALKATRDALITERGAKNLGANEAEREANLRSLTVAETTVYAADLLEETEAKQRVGIAGLEVDRARAKLRALETIAILVQSEPVLDTTGYKKSASINEEATHHG